MADRLGLSLLLALSLVVGCSAADSTDDSGRDAEAGKSSFAGSSGSAGVDDGEAGAAEAGAATASGGGAGHGDLGAEAGATDDIDGGGSVELGGQDDGGARQNQGGESPAGASSEPGGSGSGGSSESQAGASPAGGRGGTSVGGTSGGVAASSGGEAGEAGTAGTGGTEACTDPSTCDEVLADGLAIQKISLVQSVEIPLMEDGVEVAAPRNAPIVRDKDALVRVFVKRAESFELRPIRAVFQIASTGGTAMLVDEKSPSSDSTDADLDSTFNLTVPGELLTGDATYRVWLSDPGSSKTVDNPEAVFPASEPAMLGEAAQAGVIDLIITQGRYNGDGSGRLPDVSEEKLAQIRARFLALYPIADRDLTITVSDQIMDIDLTLECDGTGWYELLDYTYALDDYVDGHYHYLMVAPAETDEAYWNSVPETDGCLSGIGSAPWEVGGIAFPLAAGLSQAGTVVHEVGHNHGRLHTPCSGEGDGIDADYPYPGGSIGVWGYDPETASLLDPAVYNDFMSYCDNPWVSDYTYQGLFDWMMKTAARYAVRGTPATWQALHVTDAGVALREGTMRAPGGEAPDVTLSWLDADQRTIATTVGFVTRYAPLRDLLLLVDEIPQGAAYVHVENGPTAAMQ